MEEENNLIVYCKRLSPISSSCGHGNFVISLPTTAAFPITNTGLLSLGCSHLGCCCHWIYRKEISWRSRHYTAMLLTTPASAAIESAVTTSATIFSTTTSSAAATAPATCEPVVSLHGHLLSFHSLLPVFPWIIQA
uniref:Uncharacterized protein n=1 Tax=Pipistrellus kuhlii TaxID=59472 RepID=A0A7J7X0J5_PIPKU|nr:hypothetical protein mPipKuh1_010805 [Pipistrellus kuhlii]